MRRIKGIRIKPLSRDLGTDCDLSVTAFPVMDVNILEVPYAQNASSGSGSPLNLTFEEGQSFQWTCAAMAGVEDQLIWLFEDRPILPSDISALSEVCSAVVTQ